jgi:hypothetical protein
MPEHLVHEGKVLTITYWSEESICPLEQWFYSKNLQEADRKKIIQKIEFIANNGYPHNEEIFKKIWGDYFEIKPSGQIRLPGLIEANRFVILDHLKKKGDNYPKHYKNRLDNIRRAYENAKGKK